MKIRNILFCLTSFIVLVVSIGCKKLVDIDPPVTQLASNNVYTSNATATAVMNGIYERMIAGSNALSGSASITFLAGLSADELKNFSTSAVLQTQFYINSLSSNNVPSFWREMYQYIYTTNSVIEELTKSTQVSYAVKQQLLGEAKFTRAFNYFYLTNLYGDVPLILGTDYSANAIASRASQKNVYSQIVQDLKDSKSMLSEMYLSGDGITVSSDRIRPTKWAAEALLSRTYLYLNDWKNAEVMADSVISNTGLFSLVSDLNEVFLANSSEAIWQLQPVLPGYNTFDGYYFILTEVPNSIRPAGISNNLLSSFEAGDKRDSNWVGSFIFSGQNYFYPYKYKVQGGSPSTDLKEYLMVLRLSEQYLIRAEAEAQQNDLVNALMDLNIIRERAGLPDLSSSLTKDQILSRVMQERRIELFAEWGHRWLDLKRTNQVDAVMSLITPLKGGSWNSNWKLYPIPLTEIQNDPNLVQNSGY